MAAAILDKAGLPAQAVRTLLARKLQAASKVQGAESYIGRELKAVLEATFEHKTRLGDQFVSTEHLLLGMVTAPATQAGQLLLELGLKEDALRRAVTDLRGGQNVTSVEPESKFQALERYTTDLTALARDGKLDPVVGRDEEIRRAMQVLSRRTKNNPVLIGEPVVNSALRWRLCGVLTGQRRHPVIYLGHPQLHFPPVPCFSAFSQDSLQKALSSATLQSQALCPHFFVLGMVALLLLS